MKLTEVSIFTDEVPETAAFYKRLLGSAPVHEETGFALFQGDGFHLVVHRNTTPEESDLPSESHTGFSVADLEGTVRDLEAAGYAIAHPPRDYPWGRSAYLRDPAGRLVELSQE
jgi:catechol 2,3-dioxygenase-like lactoylglutathione lyase family enzyme